MNRYALSLDIGGSHITSALVDLDTRTIISSSVQRQAVNEKASAPELIKVWADTALASVGTVQRIHHVGVAMPGPFDYKAGISKLEHKFAALYGLNVGDLLSEALALNVPILFANDAALFALGEWWAGAAQGATRMLGITLGTGLGSGFIESGRILTQDARTPPSGEIWNTEYLDSIAEAFVSGTALVNRFEAKTQQSLEGKAIANLARQGDKNARAAFRDLGQHLNELLEPYLTSFSPDRVVLGGNLSRAFDLFEDQLNTPDKKLYCASQHFEQASLLGAAALKNT